MVEEKIVIASERDSIASFLQLALEASLDPGTQFGVGLNTQQHVETNE
jgi:hypothetical protein